MVAITFGNADLANTRFVYSPLWEAIASYCVLSYPDKQVLHLPWVREAHAALKGLDTRLLDTLIRPVPGARDKFPYHADFLTPIPTSVAASFDHELTQLRATPPSVVRDDIKRNYGTLPQELFKPFLTDPEGAVNSLADFLASYWEKTLAPHWPQLKALLEADVLYRARILALRGPKALLASLGSGVQRPSFEGQVLKLPRFASSETITLPGDGLLLVPSAFNYSLGLLPWQEVLQYQVRGVAQLWFQERLPTGAALTLLLGESRARLLKCLAVPATVTGLALRFGVTPGAVSQQLGWLVKTGLVSRQRLGRAVYYEASHIGRGLLETYGELDIEDEMLLAS